MTVPLIVTTKHFALLMEAMTELVSLAHHLETKSAKILVLLIMMTLMHVNRNVKVSLTISLPILNIYDIISRLEIITFLQSTSMYFYQKILMVSPEEINHQPQAFEEDLHLLNM